MGDKAKAQGRGRGEGTSLAITACFCLGFAYVSLLSVPMKGFASKYPFEKLIYMNSYIFHLVYFLVKCIFKRKKKRRNKKQRGGE